MPNKRDSSALTTQEDWGEYYSTRKLATLEAAARKPSPIPLIESYLNDRSESIFELGCGGSGVIARAAALGLNVGGIDFNAPAIEFLNEFLLANNYSSDGLLLGDVYDIDCESIAQQYDLLVSLGFLEHFKDPASLLKKWKRVINDEGLVISVIPNLFSINAYFMKKFDPEFWNQHISYLPEQVDQFHIDAGLMPLEKARYIGSYNAYVLVPWGNIENRIGSKNLFRIIKKVTKLLIQKPLNHLPSTNMKYFNSWVIGVYHKSDATGVEC